MGLLSKAQELLATPELPAPTKHELIEDFAEHKEIEDKSPKNIDIPQLKKQEEPKHNDNIRRDKEFLDNLKRKMDNEIRERLAHVKQIESELEEKTRQLSEKDRTLAEKEMMLKKIKEDLNNQLSEAKKNCFNDKTDKKKIDNKNIVDNIQQTKENVSINNYLKITEFFKRKLKHKEDHLESYEETLTTKQKDILQDKTELSIKELSLKKKEEALNREFKEVEAIKKSLNSTKDESNKKYAEIEAKSAMLEKDTEAIRQREEKLNEKDIELKHHQEFLQEKENELIKKEHEVNKLTGFRKFDNAKLDSQIDEKSRLYDSINKDYDSKFNYLNEKEQLLKKKDIEIIEKIRNLEEDQKELNNKEDEIIQKVNDLESDSKLLKNKEKEVIKIIEKLEKRKKLDKLEKEISKDTKILQAKEIEVVSGINKLLKAKAAADELFKRKSYFDKKIIELNNEKILHTQQFEKKYAEIQQKNQEHQMELEKKRFMLLNQEKKLAEREFLLRKREENFDESISKLALPMRQPIRPQIFAPMEYPAQRNINDKFPDNEHERVKALMAEARNFIETKDILMGEKTLILLEKEFRNLKMDKDEKKPIQYEILELKTDLNLAALG